MNLFQTYSLFRLGKSIPTLFGVFTITLHAYGNLSIFNETQNLIRFFISEFSLFSLLCGGYLMNDILDLKNDMINRPDTVYINKSMSEKTSICIVILLFIFSITSSFFASFFVGIVIGIQMAALILYNFFSKKMSYLKPFFITTLFVTIYPLSIAIAGGGIDGPRRDSLIIFPIWLFFSVLAYEFTCDAKDAKGDSIISSKGFTERFGADVMKRVARIITTAALPIAFIPYFAHMCGIIYLAGAIIAALFLLISFIYPKIDFVTILHGVIVPIVVTSILDMVIVI